MSKKDFKNDISKNDTLKDYNTYKDIKKLMRILSYMIDFLESELSSGKDISEIDSIFGSKENAISAITKLSQIFLKLHPLDEEIKNKKSKKLERELSVDDKKIIEEFIEHYNQTNFPDYFKK